MSCYNQEYSDLVPHGPTSVVGYSWDRGARLLWGWVSLQ